MDHFRDLTKKGFFKGGISFLLGRGVGSSPSWENRYFKYNNASSGSQVRTFLGLGPYVVRCEISPISLSSSLRLCSSISLLLSFVRWMVKYVLKGVKSLPLVNGNWYDYVIDEHDNLLKHGSSNIFDNSEIEINVESCKVEISIFYVYV